MKSFLFFATLLSPFGFAEEWTNSFNQVFKTTCDQQIKLDLSGISTGNTSEAITVKLERNDVSFTLTVDDYDISIQNNQAVKVLSASLYEENGVVRWKQNRDWNVLGVVGSNYQCRDNPKAKRLCRTGFQYKIYQLDTAIIAAGADSETKNSLTCVRDLLATTISSYLGPQ